MKVENVKTADDIKIYISGCLNDYEMGVSTKDETLLFLAELVSHVFELALRKSKIN